MLTNQTTGKQPAQKSCKITIPKDKLPLLLAELRKVGIVIPTEYVKVTADNFIGLLDSAVLTILAKRGDDDAAGENFFNAKMEGELGADSDHQVSEDTNTPLLH